jgi:hypothetical protein
VKPATARLILIASLIVAVMACSKTAEVGGQTGKQADAKKYNLADPKDFFLNLVNIVTVNRDILRPEVKLELRLQAKNTGTYPTRQEAEAKSKKLGADKYEVFPYQELGRSGEQWVVLEKNAVITGLDVRNASARNPYQPGSNYQISFRLSREGGKRFGEVTGAHIGDYLAILLNNEVRSIAMIQARIEDEGRITGSYTQHEAEKVAMSLNSGAVPTKEDQWTEQVSERLRSNGPEFLARHYSDWAIDLRSYSGLKAEDIEARLEPGDSNRRTLHIKVIKPGGYHREIAIHVVMEEGRLRIDER